MGLSDPLNYKLNWCRPPKESAKLRALRAKNVFTCQPDFYADVLTCQRAFRAHVPAPCVPTCLPCSGTNVSCVLTYQRALRANMP